ncbi:MAG: hypothetical protein CMM55_09290 [Rhodospirillaceae bacterium]|jgi:hypothetical protein|nr:hypothetical protein [Rhodospirillaceae bacterium]|tara:strand:- start:96 stop:278 length:183 start_codon:yes stop_codon:yes gene_type:complete
MSWLQIIAAPVQRTEPMIRNIISSLVRRLTNLRQEGMEFMSYREIEWAKNRTILILGQKQ